MSSFIIFKHANIPIKAKHEHMCLQDQVSACRCSATLKHASYKSFKNTVLLIAVKVNRCLCTIIINLILVCIRVLQLQKSQQIIKDGLRVKYV